MLNLKLKSMSPAATVEARFRRRLRNTLDELPSQLPPYNEGQLLDDLYFLLRSPLFLYAITPRLHRANTSPEPLATGLMTPDSMKDGCFPKESGCEDDLDIAKLHMDIKWDGNSWATQLQYGESVLLEGRQLNNIEEISFARSFQWFCEEARFLRYEFKARDHAAAVRLGTAIDTEPVEVRGEMSRAASDGKRRRRIVKLKI
ncbi:hypothetical protein EJ02DRAFT_313560, partial [Clathrospora elynae]